MFRKRYSVVTNSFWHRITVRRKGRKDGARGIPAPDDSMGSEFEKQLLQRGAHHLEQIAGANRSEIQRLEGSREGLIAQLRKDKTKFVDENTKYNKKKRDLGRDVTIHLPRTWYLLAIGLIVLGEFALNAQAFEVFHKPTALTWVMALTVAAGVPFVAHFLGVWVKQWPMPRWVTAAKVTVTILFTVGCLVGINIARRQYLLSQGVDVEKGADVLEWAFLLINLFVFLAATLMASFAHDEDQEVENLYQRTCSLERKLDRTDKDIHRLGGEIDRLRHLESAEIGQVRAMILELVHMYRDENLLARGDQKRPVAFQKEPLLAQPSRADEMQELTSEEEVEKIRKEWHEALDGRSSQLSVVVTNKQAVGR